MPKLEWVNNDHQEWTTNIRPFKITWHPHRSNPYILDTGGYQEVHSTLQSAKDAADKQMEKETAAKSGKRLATFVLEVASIIERESLDDRNWHRTYDDYVGMVVNDPYERLVLKVALQYAWNDVVENAEKVLDFRVRDHPKGLDLGPMMQKMRDAL